MLTLNDGRVELWQWDTGRTLAVDADCSQVHFSNKVFGRSIDVDVIDGVAIIPDILLQTDKDLNVWAFVGTAENGYTKISKTFKVNRRNKPADYVFTPTEQMTIQTIQSQIGDLADLTTEAKDTLVAAINEAAQSGDENVKSAELDEYNIVSFKNADGIVLFTLDLSELGTPASYGNLVLSTASMSIKEGQSATFTVTLDSAPSANQTVYMSASDSAKLTVTPASLTFTHSDWNVAQTVTVEVPSGITEGSASVTIASSGVDSIELPVVIEAASPFMEVAWLNTAYVVGENANAQYNAWCPDTAAYDSTRDKIVFMQYHATSHTGNPLGKTVVTINPYDPTVYEKVEAFPEMTSGDGVGGLLVKDGVWTAYGIKKRHRTSDGGTTWESVDVVTPPARMYGVFEIDGVLYCGDDYSTTDAAHNGWYYVSYDDGLNWEQKVFDFANDYAIPCSEARFCKWQGKLYAAIRREANKGLLARLDGDSWVVVTDQLPNVTSDTSCTPFDDMIAMSSIDRPNRKLILSTWNGSELTVVKEYNFDSLTSSGDFHTPTYVKGNDWQAVFFMINDGIGSEYFGSMNAAVFGYKEGVAANTPTYEIAKGTYTWEDVLAEPCYNCTVAISDSGVEIDATDHNKYPYIAISKRWGAGTYAPNEDGTIRDYSFNKRIGSGIYIPNKNYNKILMDTKTVGDRTYLCVVKSNQEVQIDGTVPTKIIGIANELVVEGSDMSGAPYVARAFEFSEAGTSHKTTGTTYSAV